MSDEKIKTEAEIYKAAYEAMDEASRKPLAYGAAMRAGINRLLSNLGMERKLNG